MLRLELNLFFTAPDFGIRFRIEEIEMVPDDRFLEFSE